MNSFGYSVLHLGRFRFEVIHSYHNLTPPELTVCFDGEITVILARLDLPIMFMVGAIKGDSFR